MRSPLFLLLAVGILTGCGETTPSLAPDREPEIAKGGVGKPGTGNITIVSLGFTKALDIDEQGRVVGYDQSRTGTRGVLWTPVASRGTSGSITDLGNLGGGETYAFGINEEGLITGGSADATAHHPFVWDGGIHALGEPTGAAGGFADDLSDPSGDTRYVAGRIDFAAGSRAAVWRLSGSNFQDAPALLPGLRPDNVGQAFASNAAGTVVGDALGSTGLVPARWTFSGTTWSVDRLDLLDGTDYGQAFDVNADGAAVGYNGRNNATGCNRGAVWAPGSTTATALQDLAGGSCSTAWAINRAGQITGWAHDARGRQQAVLWVPKAGGYSVLALGRPGEGRGLNEPELDAAGVPVVEVVGGSTLWKVKLP